MRLKILALALTPCTADGMALAWAHEGQLDMNRKTQLLRGTASARGGHCADMGSLICTRNNVSVLERRNEDGKWERSLQFGSECATESTVLCVNSKACAGSCTDSCPCNIDESARLSVNYMETMFAQLGPVCSKADSHVLMLGLGAGEFTQYLLQHCPGMRVDAVELNGDVISMARSYFGLRESEQKFAGRLAIEKADALTAVKERAQAAEEGYDAVLIDCFSGGGEVPESCRSRDMAERVKEVLKPTGVLLQNIWHYSKMRQQVRQEFDATKAIYSDVFEGSLEDVLVPMPPQIQWVNILKATKKQDLSSQLKELEETMDSARGHDGLAH